LTLCAACTDHEDSGENTVANGKKESIVSC